MNPDQNQRRPFWLWQTKRFFPSRIFAGAISLASLTVGMLLGGVALNVAGCWPVIFPSLLFVAGGLATAAAVFAGPNEANDDNRQVSAGLQSDKPTLAIIVLLIGVYSWMLTIAMHIFRAFFKNGPGSTKYFITLAIAVSATAFMKFYGQPVVRKHFGRQGGRNLEIDGWQAVWVTLLVVGCGCYLAWLVM